MQAAIAACRVLQTSSVTYEKRGTSEGLIRGELFFVDGSVLHYHKHVENEGNVIAAPACDLLTVLREVASVVQLSE